MWDDQFSHKRRVSRKKWIREHNCAGGGNFEEQCYTRRSANAYTRDGILHLVARPETWQGPAVSEGHPDYKRSDQSVQKEFTSARIRSKFSFRYGRVDIRAKLASGQGSWPALWMLPTDDVYGEWPNSGEIDIVEAVNLQLPCGDNSPSVIEGALHYGLPWPQWKVNFDTLTLEEDQCNAAAGFHVYSIEWEAQEIRWYFDGIHIHTQQATGWYNYIWQGQDVGFGPASPTAPFDQRFHLILNVAVGGLKPGAPDTSTWPLQDPDGTPRAELQVDYVRVYQCTVPTGEGGERMLSEDGSGCATRDENVAVNTDAGVPGIQPYVLFSPDEGPATLSLPAGGRTVTNTLQPGLWQLNEGNVEQSIVQDPNEDGFVWSITFRGLGNIFLTADDMADDPSVEQGVTLVGGAGWTKNGELRFEMRVLFHYLAAEEDTTFWVKMDSGYPNVGQVAMEIPPADGAWHAVVVRVSGLLATSLEGGSGIDVANVVNLFVLEYTGTSEIQVQLRNIELNCAYNTSPEEWQLDQLCSLQGRPTDNPEGLEGRDELNVYNTDGYGDWNGDGVPDFVINLSAAGAGIEEGVFFDVGERALKFTFDDDPASNTVPYFESLEGDLDLSAWTGGTVEFDLYVETDPRSDTVWFVKVECGYPCGSGDVPLTDSVENVVPPPVGAWQHYTFSVDRFVQGNGQGTGLDLTRVSVPLTLFPAWANQDGVVYYLRRVKWVKI